LFSNADWFAYYSKGVRRVTSFGRTRLA